MRLTSVFGFAQTVASFAKSGSKAKGEYILVQCHSVATGYQVDLMRDFLSLVPLTKNNPFAY